MHINVLNVMVYLVIQLILVKHIEEEMQLSLVKGNISDLFKSFTTQ